MLQLVRATIRLYDRLLRDLKATRFRIITFKGRVDPSVDLDDSAALIDLMEGTTSLRRGYPVLGIGSVWSNRDVQRERKEKQEEIARLSADLRSGEDSFWVRIRELLLARGLDPNQTVLAQLHTEDTNLWLGIVVAPSRRIFEFTYDHLDKPIDEGQFRDWIELTDQVSNSAFAGAIECALDLVPRRPS